ncbi:MAG: hypothetical protein K9K32_00230 [Halanaerobiales bacterium]|nr:hypothetical protein [Halanaerobiales bacterium]
MRLFDTINFKCDNCGQPLEIQTKAGVYSLNTYSIPQLASKPIKYKLSMLDDICGEKVHCSACGYTNQINIISSPSIKINS